MILYSCSLTDDLLTTILDRNDKFIFVVYSENSKALAPTMIRIYTFLRARCSVNNNIKKASSNALLFTTLKYGLVFACDDGFYFSQINYLSNH